MARTNRTISTRTTTAIPVVLAVCDAVPIYGISSLMDSHLPPNTGTTSDVSMQHAVPLLRHPVYGPDMHEAYAQSRRLGLRAEDSEDCAMEFLVHKLSHQKAFDQDPALRRHCAKMFALNYYRTISRREGRLLPSADLGLKLNLSSFLVIEEMPEQALLHASARGQLTLLVERLSPVPRLVVRRHYLEGEVLADLAHSLGRTVHSLEQLLCRARVRLRALAHAAGWEAWDLLGCLVPYSPCLQQPKAACGLESQENETV